MNAFRKRLIILAVCAAAVIVGYIVLHELGHCVVALMFGARITEFSVLTAHMRSEGGEFTPGRSMLLNAGGMLLPYIIGVVWLALYRGGRGGGIYRACSFIYFVASLYSVTPWILIPITYARGFAPEGDDVTRFLITYSYLGGSPVTVVSGAVVMLIFYLALLIRKDPAGDFMDYMAGKTEAPPAPAGESYPENKNEP